MRAGADYGHVSLEHVDELRQLVNARAAQEVTELGLTGIVLSGLHRVGVRIHFH